MISSTSWFLRVFQLESGVTLCKTRLKAVGPASALLLGLSLLQTSVWTVHAQTPARANTTVSKVSAAQPVLLAQIQRMRGDVVVIKPTAPQTPMPATIGMDLPVGSVIRTGKGSNATIAIVQQLPATMAKAPTPASAALPAPEPIVHAQATLTSQSTVLLSSIADGKGEPAVVLELQNGYVQSRVGEQLRGLLSPANASREPYKVRTRMATIGVRGTYFGVSNNPARNTVTTSLLQGKVALSTAQEASAANSPSAQSADMAVALTPDFGAVIKDTPSTKASVRVQPLPDAPAWIADGHVLDTQERASLRWRAVSDADRYVVELSNDAAFSDIVSQAEVDSKDLQTAEDGGALNLFYNQHFEALPKGFYHARVAAKTEDGLMGRFATTVFQRRQYEIQTGQQLNASQGSQLLYWSALPEAKYRVTVSKNLSNESPVLQINGLTHNFVELSNLPAGQYQWKVQAYIPHPTHSNVEVQSTPVSLLVTP